MSGGIEGCARIPQDGAEASGMIRKEHHAPASEGINGDRGDGRGSLEAGEEERRVRGCCCTAWAGRQQGRTVIETRRRERGGRCTSESDSNGGSDELAGHREAERAGFEDVRTGGVGKGPGNGGWPAGIVVELTGGGGGFEASTLKAQAQPTCATWLSLPPPGSYLTPDRRPLRPPVACPGTAETHAEQRPAFVLYGALLRVLMNNRGCRRPATRRPARP